MEVIGLISRVHNSFIGLVSWIAGSNEERCQIYEDLGENLDVILHVHVPLLSSQVTRELDNQALRSSCLDKGWLESNILSYWVGKKKNAKENLHPM